MVLARVYGRLGVARTRANSRSHTRTLTVPASILTPATVLGALRAICRAEQGESDHFQPRPFRCLGCVVRDIRGLREGHRDAWNYSLTRRLMHPTRLLMDAPAPALRAATPARRRIIDRDLGGGEGVGLEKERSEGSCCDHGEDGKRQMHGECNGICGRAQGGPGQAVWGVRCPGGIASPSALKQAQIEVNAGQS